MTIRIIPQKMKKRESYRNILSKDGKISAHISAETSERIRNYCIQRDIAVTRFVEDCINAQLDILEREALNNLSKEMLIELLIAKKNEVK